jgi:hypothetical protein
MEIFRTKIRGCGYWDSGPKGVIKFLSLHTCNAVCHALGLDEEGVEIKGVKIKNQADAKKLLITL